MTEPSARVATRYDLRDLKVLYERLDEEMTRLRPGWPGGVEPPIEAALSDRLDTCTVIVGTIDDVPVGFLTATVVDSMRSGRTVTVEFLFTEPEARGVGVGEAMLERLRAELPGVHRFDVAVLPGHRDAKNFLEGQGFKARTIIMHHEDS
jgi:GNAT superfamily N-acetyltransferase